MVRIQAPQKAAAKHLGWREDRRDLRSSLAHCFPGRPVALLQTLRCSFSNWEALALLDSGNAQHWRLQ